MYIKHESNSINVYANLLICHSFQYKYDTVMSKELRFMDSLKMSVHAPMIIHVAATLHVLL